LYTREEAERCLDQLRIVDFHERFAVVPDVTVCFGRAGHIVGSACVSMEINGRRLTFSGDVGRPADPIMKPPELFESCDYLVIESTYGDRRHPQGDIRDELATVVCETVERRGVVVVPAFAVGRAQHLLLLLSQLRQENRIPACPVFLDSPMAIDATEIMVRHADDHRLTPEQCTAMFRLVSYSQTAEDSKAIDRRNDPMIVISASGMCTGGRVLHHLQRFLPDPRATILFVGYQGAGTRGRTLVDGADELKLLGGYVPVRARVVQLDGLSAHADYAELIEWLGRADLSPRRVFVTHGEPPAADALRRRLQEAFSWNTRVPEIGERVELV
jgi:metallo-beta-lactamase family protein